MLFILFWTSTVRVTWQSMDSHKPPGFHLKYLKLCSEITKTSEDEKAFTVWNDMFNVFNDKMLMLGWSNPLSCILSVSTFFLDEYIFYKKKNDN